MKWLRFGIFGLAAGSTLWADEYAVLRSGFRMAAQKIEKQDGSYVLTTAGGAIVLAEAEVISIEKDDYVAPPVVPVAKQVIPPTPPPKPIPQMIDEAAGRHGLPPAFVRSVAKAESGMKADAVSRAGAVGVMQLMPSTAAALHADPADPEQNIEAGTRYLRDLLLKYDGDAAKALAAYNAGPGAVDKYNGVPPYSETVTYVDRVIQDYKKSTH
jgi:soluble lytic murein transglycosylase-like protein